MSTSDSKYAIEATYKDQVVFRGILENPPVTLGRSKKCDIPFEKYDFLSRNHIEFYKKDGLYFFRDLKSSNGVSKNGQKVTGGQITDQLLIHVGELRFQFRLVTAKQIADKPSPNQSNLSEKTITEISIHGTMEEAIELESIYEDLKMDQGTDIGIELVSESGVNKKEE